MLASDCHGIAETTARLFPNKSENLLESSAVRSGLGTLAGGQPPPDRQDRPHMPKSSGSVCGIMSNARSTKCLSHHLHVPFVSRQHRQRLRLGRCQHDCLPILRRRNAVALQSSRAAAHRLVSPSQALAGTIFAGHCLVAKCRRTSSRASLRTGQVPVLVSAHRCGRRTSPARLFAIDADNICSLRASHAQAPHCAGVTRLSALPSFPCPPAYADSRQSTTSSTALRRSISAPEHDSADDGSPNAAPAAIRRNATATTPTMTAAPTLPPKFCNQTATTLPTVICCFGCRSSSAVASQPRASSTPGLPEPSRQNHGAAIMPAPKLTGREFILADPRQKRRIIVPIQQAMDQRFEVANLRLQHQNVFAESR